ncbi:MAG: CoA pyrophosphatase [Proteobacteria bacterium]|nr:CoA pyrophosphatase [Pseudomonadota bacterium]
MFDLNDIRLRLATHSPTEFDPNHTTRKAAVAIILRQRAEQADILFIKRAEKDGDPWSGHMAFPGGHLESHDDDLKAAAMRETLEEIGLDLSMATYLGAIDQQRAQPRGRVLNMLIAPHVFELHDEPTFDLNYEVAEVVWSPLAPLAFNHLHDTEIKPMMGKPTVFNGYRLSDRHFVWGLTYRMLKSFFLTLDQQWQEADTE